MKTKIYWPLVIWGIVSWFVETRYFGYNMTAQSVAELWADAISMLAFMVGLFFPIRTTEYHHFTNVNVTDNVIKPEELR